jgi:uncharacterized membrane protein
MGIAYALAYAVTGSAVFSGLALLAELVINVLLLPIHEAAWAKWRRDADGALPSHLGLAAEKLSQTSLHAGVAFGTMYAVTGSLQWAASPCCSNQCAMSWCFRFMTACGIAWSLVKTGGWS